MFMFPMTRGGGEFTNRFVARAEQLPFKTEAFDLVLSKNILELTIYQQDQRAIFLEIYRVLKIGGFYLADEGYDYRFSFDKHKPVEGFQIIECPWMLIYKKQKI